MKLCAMDGCSKVLHAYSKCKSHYSKEYRSLKAAKRVQRKSAIKYKQSPGGKAANLKYWNSPKGKIVRARCRLNAKLKKLAQEAAQ